MSIRIVSVALICVMMFLQCGESSIEAIIPEMVLIPAGDFMMGEDNGKNFEYTAHKVQLDSFYIGKYEVTQMEWKSVMGNNPSNFKSFVSLLGFLGYDDHPVESVSWNDVQEYLEKLSELTGNTYRLPTEAEWEYACRAGSTTEYCYGDDDSRLGDYAWYLDNSGKKTHPVGQKLPNDWGLYDMHGNVYEWCSDWYGRYYYQECYDQGTVTNPLGPNDGSSRFPRGGGWADYSSELRSTYRYGGHDPSSVNFNIGFRCVREMRK
ncbi:formylglycine-generating enzyme family protein [candidate division KSB1 bacterium]